MAKLAYEKAHADIVKYDNSDLLQTRSGEDGCYTKYDSNNDCPVLHWYSCNNGLAQIDQGMDGPTL